MAQFDHHSHPQSLKLNTQLGRQESSSRFGDTEQIRFQRPSFKASHPSQDTIRASATPPIEIPGQDEGSAAIESASPLNPAGSFAERFLRERKTSVSFDNEVKTDSGRGYSILEPIKQYAERALSEQRITRAHSESDTSHYDPLTGRQLPQYSDSPPNEDVRVGEARFPLLQRTVDALARHSIDMQQPMSMTSEATISPVEEAVLTPPDVRNHLYPSSPVNISPSLDRHFSSSYESPHRKDHRKASERWKSGEATSNFFARAGSLKKSEGRKQVHRDTFSSTRSPRSAASSFLGSFSMSGSHHESAPLPVDAEGATVGEDYVLGKQIGYGGFSIIREVKQISSQTGQQRTLAVKIVKKHIDGKSKAENDAAQIEFEHEVDLWRLLNHKHILALEAVYELKEATFCFVPLNVGGTLFDVVHSHRQGLRMDHAMSYTYQLASALRYLHLDAHVVHRDVKLENCLVDFTSKGTDEPGHLRLCDFGLAQWISSDNDSNTSESLSSDNDADHDRPLSRYFGPSDSSTSAFAGGSLEYAAPEILRIATNTSGSIHPGDLPPEKSVVSTPVDIWAMGVCVYALLMGRRPFQDNFQPRVVMAILGGNWDKAALREKAGDQAYRLVKSCLRMNFVKRASISEIIDNVWLDEVRTREEGSDAESESARAGGWRL